MYVLAGLVTNFWSCQALIQAREIKEFNEIFDAVSGVLFLGTPHQGSQMSWAAKLLAILTTPFFGSNKMLLRTLEYHEDGLINLQQQFSRLLDKTDKQVYAFYESLPTRVFGLSVGLVCLSGAILSLPKVICIGC